MASAAQPGYAQLALMAVVRGGFGGSARHSATATLPKYRMGSHERVALAILGLCLFENFVLALANNYLVRVNASVVMAVQGLLTAGVLALALRSRPRVTRWFGWALYGVVALFLIGSWRSGTLDWRFLYNVSMIPVFILLGSTLRVLPLKVLWLLTAVVLVGALIEVALPDAYASVVNPLSYFANTRSWVAEQLRTGVSEAGLYLGAYRPGGSIFFSAHRAGSIFLEPLSLGYFAVILSFTFGFFYRKRRWLRYGAIILCLLIAFLADSRIAVAGVAGSVLLWPIAERMPGSVVGAMPWIALGVVAVVAVASWQASGSSDLGYRLAITSNGLEDAKVIDLLFGGFYAASTYDSGIMMIISHCGVFGVPLVLGLCSGIIGMPQTHAPLKVSAFLYALLASLFGGALFSIKTAALLGMVVGFVEGGMNRGVPWGAGEGPRSPAAQASRRLAIAGDKRRDDC